MKLIPKSLFYIQTIITEGSITAAAKKLYIAQPSLSQMIKTIEGELGVPIFNRNTNPISLTFAGQRYLHAMNQIDGSYRNMISEIDAIKGEEKGVLRLGISLQRGLSLLPQVLSVYCEKHPQIDIDLYEFGSTKLEGMLEECKLDLAFITTEPNVSAINYNLIQNEEIGVLAAKTSDLAKRIPHNTTIDIMDIENETCVGLKSGHSAREVQDFLL